MKKGRIVALVALVAVALVTGCTAKEKKLVCKQETSGVLVEFNVGFKGNIIKSMDFNYDMDLSKYKDNQIALIEKQDFCSSVKRSMSDYKNAFTDCKQEIKDKHLLVSSVLDVDKIAKNVTDKMTTPEKGKAELEKQGYKCSIE